MACSLTRQGFPAAHALTLRSVRGSPCTPSNSPWRSNRSQWDGRDGRNTAEGSRAAYTQIQFPRPTSGAGKRPSPKDAHRSEIESLGPASRCSPNDAERKRLHGANTLHAIRQADTELRDHRGAMLARKRNFLHRATPGEQDIHKLRPRHRPNGLAKCAGAAIRM